jgi:cysteinyl-tRNA synthetase
MTMKNYPIYIQNTLTRKKEEFVPIVSGKVGMYVCGPTVYSDVHLGNVRTFLSFDLIYRYLKHLGYAVRYVRNITDVGHLVADVDEGEDKIARRARLENLEPMEIVQKYTNGFHAVMRIFNIEEPDIEPTATGHLIEQMEMVQRILDKGLAYEVNGSVYFDVEKYRETYNYGLLSGRRLEDLEANTRELDGQQDKKNPFDFALWKKAEKGHLMKWNSPWGVGFPGWHLECSVMSTKYLGETFDIHGGGMDLKFPHHECEIAQSTAADDASPVNYWIHTNMLTVNGKKMAKSEGNGFTPEELISGNHPLLERGYSPMTIRFFMLQTHYASTLDFSNQALQASEKGYQRLLEGFEALRHLEVSQDNTFDFERFESESYKRMGDDFNSPQLIAHLFDGIKTVKQIKQGEVFIDQSTKDRLIELYKSWMFDVLGFRIEDEQNEVDFVDDLMDIILSIRNAAKLRRDWDTADKIRDKLSDLGIAIKDKKEGSIWTRK